MNSFLLHISVICFSLIAWCVLSINAFFTFLDYRNGKEDKTIALIIMGLWGTTTYNAWYEGFVLFEQISLIPSLNSWAFSFITPLFYLYYHFRITGCYPDLAQWVKHLLLPAVLLGCYVGIYLFGASPDKLIYSWSEFQPSSDFGWMLFRIICYLFLAVQLSAYLPRLFGSGGIGNDKTPKARQIKKEMSLVLCFCFTSMVAMLTPYHLSKLFYNFSVIALGVYLLSPSPTFRIIRRKLTFYLIPFPKVSHRSAHTPPDREKPIVWFTADEERQVSELLTTPGFLHNPNLTISMLANKLATNETYLSRYFNRQLGVSFPEYINSHRLVTAESLLKETDLSVVEISEQVGFQTLSTFYQAFNTKYKMPPSQWRKKNAQNGNIK